MDAKDFELPLEGTVLPAQGSNQWSVTRSQQFTKKQIPKKVKKKNYLKDKFSKK